MKTWRIPLLLLFVVGTLAALDWSYSVPQLPDRVPVHFDAEGRVGRWEDRNEFVRGSSLWLLLAPLGILAIGAFSSLLVRILPASLINVPRKDYWLTTAERRAEAAALLFGFFLWISVSLLAIGAAVTHTIFVAARNPAAPQLWPMTAVIVGAILLLLVRIVLLMVRLSYPPQATDNAVA